MKSSTQRLVTALVIAGLTLGVFTPKASQAATVNTIIKGSHATLYWYAADGERYVFPNIQTFYSWFPSSMLSQVKRLSNRALNQIPIGGNVTYRGGYRLVKFATDPRVYAVSRYGVLHLVVNPDVAGQLYGWNWHAQIDTIPDMYFSNYTVGAPIYSGSDYSVSNEYNSVSTPSDNIAYSNVNPSPIVTPVPYYDNSGAGIQGDTTLQTTITSQDSGTVTVQGRLHNATLDTENITIKLYDQTTDQLLQTCTNTYSCSTTMYNSSVRTDNIYSIASDQYQSITSNILTITYGQTQTYPAPIYNPVYNPIYSPYEPNYSTYYAPAFAVTNVSVTNNSNNTNSCYTSNNIIGSISTNEAGTVSYVWNENNGTTSPVQYLYFANSGTQTVTLNSANSGLSNQGSVSLMVESPNNMSSNSVYVQNNSCWSQSRYNGNENRYWNHRDNYHNYVPTTPSVSVNASVYPTTSYSCSQQFTFTGNITSNQAGTVYYTWNRSDGATYSSPTRSVTFSAPGTLTVSDTWDISTAYSGSETLQILSPNGISSNPASFSLNCNGYQY